MSEELKAQAIELCKKHGKELALEMIELIAIPALEEACKKSATPVDDVVLAALKEPLKHALKELLEKV